MFKFFKNSKNSKMKKRIKNLHEKLVTIHRHYGTKSDLLFYYNFNPYRESFVDEVFKVSRTIYGDRMLGVTPNTLRYFKYRGQHRCYLTRMRDYVNTPNELCDNIIFEISCNPNSSELKVSPKIPNLTLNAHEIDLAILEFENIIEEEYKQVLKFKKDQEKLEAELNK